MNNDCPKCDKCDAPITTGSMAVFCAFGRECEFVEDDSQWESVENFRKCFGIERNPMPSSDDGLVQTASEPKEKQ